MADGAAFTPAKPATEADELKAYVARIMANRPKRSQLGSMFDEREEDHANTWVPRRHLLEG